MAKARLPNLIAAWYQIPLLEDEWAVGPPKCPIGPLAPPHDPFTALWLSHLGSLSVHDRIESRP